MKPTLLKPTAVAILGFLSLSAFASELPKELKERYDLENKATESRDLNGFKKMLSKDFINVGPDGKKANLKQWSADIAPLFKAKKIAVKETFPKFVKKGASYEVWYDIELRLTYMDGKSEFYKETGVDTWKKLNNEWLTVKSVVKIAKTTPLK